MRFLARSALAVALLVALAACGEDAPELGLDEEPTPAVTEPAPTPTPTPTPTPAPDPDPTPTPDEQATPEGATEVTVYYVREHDSGVWVEPETVTLDEPTVAVAGAAMQALLTRTPSDPARASLAADGAELLGVDRDEDVLTVDVRNLVGNGLGAGSEQALVQQIAHTGTQFDGVRAVQILVDGEPVETLAGHVDVRDPVEPDPLTLSPVTFTSHETGAAVDTGPVTVAGEACTFEATVELALEAPDGTVVEDTFTTATVGCPDRGEWEHTFTLDEPGTWTIIATEPDPAAGEGRPPFQTSLTLEAS